MSASVNLVVAQRTSDSFRTHGNTLLATCLLCRVLWPTTLQHRHLPLVDSSEAKTILRTKMGRSE